MKNLKNFENYSNSSKTKLYNIIVYDVYKHDNVYGKKIVLLLTTRSSKDAETIKNEFEESDVFKKMCKEDNVSLVVKVRPTDSVRISIENMDDEDKKSLKY